MVMMMHTCPQRVCLYVHQSGTAQVRHAESPPSGVTIATTDVPAESRGCWLVTDGKTGRCVDRYAGKRQGRQVAPREK